MIRLQIVWQPRLRHNSEICRMSSQTTEKRVLQRYLAAPLRFGLQKPSRALKARAHARQSGDRDQDERSVGKSCRGQRDMVQV